MRRLIPVILAGLLAGNSAPADDIPQLQSAVRGTIRDVQPSVVQVLTTREVGVPGIDSAVASGFFVDTAGGLVTAAHVVRHAERVEVSLHDERIVSARIIGVDELHDIAFLKADVVSSQPLAWAPASDLAPGVFVLAMGAPFGLGPASSFGIISAVGRQLHQDSGLRFIQTDAAINSGNSGGPLVDLEGRVVGVNIVIMAPSGVSSGVGFAVPSDVAEQVVRQLASGQEQAPGWLGAVLQNQGQKTDGLTVRYVYLGTPAEVLRPGDKVVAINGEPVHSVDAARLRVANVPAGDYVTLRLADGTEHPLKTRERPERMAMSRRPLGEDLKPVSRPLTAAEEAFITGCLQGRVCECGRAVSLLSCADCSGASADRSFVRQWMLSGDSADRVKQRLNAPVRLVAWVDYAGAQSRAVLRDLQRVERQLGSLVYIRLRHFPSNPGSVESWRLMVNLVETARELGKYHEAHQYLIRVDAGRRLQTAATFAEAMNIPPDTLTENIRESRFEKQIWKDLTDAQQLDGVIRAPVLKVQDRRFERGMRYEQILSACEQAVFELSL